jgi:hypothetical protein
VPELAACAVAPNENMRKRLPRIIQSRSAFMFCFPWRETSAVCCDHRGSRDGLLCHYVRSRDTVRRPDGTEH